MRNSDQTIVVTVPLNGESIKRRLFLLTATITELMAFARSSAIIGSGGQYDIIALKRQSLF